MSGSVADAGVGRLFERWAALSPEQPAIRTPDEAVSYGDLNRRANRIAHAIQRHVMGPESVATLLGSAVTQVSVFLATLKVGQRFVPIDPGFPAERTQFVLDDAHAKILITDHRQGPGTRTLAPGVVVLDLDELEDDLSEENPAETVPRDAHTWIVYTSGTTGVPKGVLQNHRNLLHYLRLYADAFRVTSKDRVTTLFPFTVNGALHDILLSLGTGATLCPWDAKELGFAGLATWLKSQGTTIYSSVPTAFRQLAAGVTDQDQFPALRLIRLWGEPSYRRDFVAFQKLAPDHCVLVNRIGASETGPVCWQFFDKHSTFDGNNLPVGFPTPGHEVSLVDEHRRPVPGGDPGEIVVHSRFLSPGYWRRERETQAAFEVDPCNPEMRLYHTGDVARLRPDGCLVPLGRRDHQIKIRGYRVEVDEIEHALVSIDGVEDAVAVARSEPGEDPRLVAYFVGSAASPSVSALRRVLAGRLPDYMIPAAFVRLDSFPLAPNGKIARRQLPPPGRERPSLEAPYVPATSATEQWLVGLWENVLRLDRIGVNDPFLELGGDSLLAAQIASRASERFHRRVPMRLLFEHPTVADLAAVIEALEIQTVEQLRGAIPRASRAIPADSDVEPSR